MHWNGKGPGNTEGTIRLALQRARELGVQHMVVASCSGQTAKKLWSEGNKDGLTIVCVTHHIGFSEPGGDEMPLAVREELAGLGVKILTNTHLLAGVDKRGAQPVRWCLPGGNYRPVPAHVGAGVKGMCRDFSYGA